MAFKDLFRKIHSRCGYSFFMCERSHRSMLAARKLIKEAGICGFGEIFSISDTMCMPFELSAPDDTVMLRELCVWRHMADQIALAFKGDRLCQVGRAYKWPMERPDDPDDGFFWVNKKGWINANHLCGEYPLFQEFKECLMASKVLWSFVGGPYALAMLHRMINFNGSGVVQVIGEIETLQAMKDWLDGKDEGRWMDTEESREAVACLILEQQGMEPFYDILRYDESWRVRRALVLNPALSFGRKSCFLDDPDWRVRCEMVELDEPYMKMEAGERLVNDPEYEVRIRMAARMVDPLRRRMIISRHDSMGRYIDMLEHSQYNDDFKDDVVMEAAAL